MRAPFFQLWLGRQSVLLMLGILMIMNLAEGQGQCPTNPCRNGATCRRFGNSDVCFCATGFRGSTCESEDPCIPNPCIRGWCSVSSTTHSPNCHCFPNYGGDRCEVLRCTPNQCNGRGLCIVSQITNTTSCHCRPGFSGDRCQYDPCTPNPCNGGQCLLSPPLSSPFSTSGNRAYCRCPPGYDAPRCTIVPCITLQCHNGGTCYREVTGYGPHEYCRCVPGFSGRNCSRRVPPCTDRCQGFLPCIVGAGNSFSCTCPSGRPRHSCLQPSECYPEYCLNGGECSAVNGELRCECATGFTGTQCEIQNNRCSLGYCQNGGQCTILGTGNETCQCQLHFTGDFCQTPICTAGYCKHGGQCSVLSGGIRCTCPAGFTGDRCELSFVCFPGYCQNGGQCHDFGIAVCLCPPGFKGHRCQACVDQHYLCSKWAVSGHCHGTYRPYMEEYCHTACGLCLATGECYQELCLNGGKCSEINGGLYCQCATGFTGLRCVTRQICPDQHYACSAWAELGYCVRTYQAYMEKNCRTACGLC